MQKQDVQLIERADKGAGQPVFLQGRALWLARALWVAVFLLAVALFLAGIPGRWVLAAKEATDQLVGHSQAGLTVGVYAAIKVGANIALAAVSSTIGLVIFLRRAREPMALFVAIMLVALGQIGNSDALRGSGPSVQLLVGFVNLVAWTSFTLFFYLFPDGRFVPPWSRWVALVAVLANLYPGTPPMEFQVALLIGPLAIAIAAQIYRYLRISTLLQRQQTKWVVFGGMAGYIGGTAIGAALWVLWPAVNEKGSLAFLILYATGTFLFMLIPLSVGAAILRYRLYEIDLIIRRTLIYALLTALLAGVYFGGVVLLQALLKPLTGEGNDLAIVATTLLIAALFLPLRRRVQGLIDRRFYRRKYDAARTLAQFSETMRDEVDLSRLTSRLLEVVEETMQPAHASLWLRTPERKAASDE
jgi:hypothetical protein